MKGNDLINYNINLVDAANHFKEQNDIILNRCNEYNKKASSYFKMDSLYHFIRDFVFSSKIETIKYSDAISKYVKKVDGISSKSQRFLEDFNNYIENKTASHYELLKEQYESIKSTSINYPRYNPYIQRVRRRLSTERNEDMVTLEGETRLLNDELKSVISTIDDMMETVELFELKNAYDGEDYIRRYEYSKSMIKKINDVFKYDEPYYTNKKQEYLKFINLVESVKINKFAKDIMFEFNDVDIMCNGLMDKLVNLMTGFKNGSMNLMQVDKKEKTASSELLFLNKHNRTV